MHTLTYGTQIPDSGDRGVPLFTALEQNFTRWDGHSHNGIDSPLLTAQAFAGIADTISHTNWVTYGGPIGHYRQLVTMHAGFLFDSVFISFRLTTGQYVYPTVERVSSTTYYVYTTDPTLDFIAVYGG